MSPAHPHPDDFARYILGDLAPETAAHLEAHTLECPPCARRLAAEALLEERLREVARAARPARVLRPARWHPAARTAAGVGLAAAAALVLLLLPPRPSRPETPRAREDGLGWLALPADAPPSAGRLVACPDLTSQEDCASQALARGLWVQYPRGLGEVPRYEGRPGSSSRPLADGPSPL